jgi:hypothetical protein
VMHISKKICFRWLPAMVGEWRLRFEVRLDNCWFSYTSTVEAEWHEQVFRGPSQNAALTRSLRG